MLFDYERYIKAYVETWVSLINNIPPMSSMNLESMKSAGNVLRIMFFVLDYLVMYLCVLFTLAKITC